MIYMFLGVVCLLVAGLAAVLESARRYLDGDVFSWEGDDDDDYL